MSNENQTKRQVNVAENNSGKGGDYPVLDIIKDKFNWGAFLLSWIWGIGNKTYITLIMLVAWLLGFIPFVGALLVLGIHIWFGIKGNEWAWQNKRFPSIKAFHEYQKKWAIAGIIISILWLSLIVAIPVVFLSEFLGKPENREYIMEKMDSTIIKTGNLYFKKYNVSEEVNNFYIESSEWNSCSYDEKIKLLDMAATISAVEKTKREKDNPQQNSRYPERYDKTTELPKTKIYSYEKNQLLAEFSINTETLVKGSFKEILKESLKAYKIYDAE